MTSESRREVEGNINAILVDVLKPMLQSSIVVGQNTSVLERNTAEQPDVLITTPGRSPVIIETEYHPGSNVEKETIERIGARVIGQFRPIEAGIAVKLPTTLKAAYDRANAIRNSTIEFAVHYLNHRRFPTKGWITGSIQDLAETADLVSIPNQAIELAISALRDGIERAGNILDETATLAPQTVSRISEILETPDSKQTRRIAMSIVANAMIFQEKLSVIYENVDRVRDTAGNDTDNPQSETDRNWQTILNINYWPVFAIAKDILRELPTSHASRILRELCTTVQNINATGIENTRDLAGQIFQRFIEDREFLAAYYTLPTSAALLARIAVSKLTWVDWSSRDSISNLKIVDMACGTGALLSAVYEQIRSLHERAGGKPAEIHRSMMEQGLRGYDIIPMAVHITSSTLSGSEPTVEYKDSQIQRLPYGQDNTGGVQVGSLEFLRRNVQMTHANYTNPAVRVTSKGPITAAQTIAELQDESMHLVIMNPPFKSNTSHEGKGPDVAKPAFAGLGTSKEEQDKMSKQAIWLARNTCSDGNSGLASYFAALAHKKIMPGGVIALVLPLSSAIGQSWKKFRDTIAEHYTDIDVISIANSGNRMSFSSDTAMAECLVIGRKKGEGKSPSRPTFTSLTQRPQGFAQAMVIARTISNKRNLKRIEGGPLGGTPVQIGDEKHGESISTPTLTEPSQWLVRIKDHSLAQTAQTLCNSELILPGFTLTQKLPIAPLKEFSERGLLSRDLTGGPPSPGKLPRGPFEHLKPYTEEAVFPALWNHHNEKETQLVCNPDSYLNVREDLIEPNDKKRDAMARKLAEKAKLQWTTASRVHLNVEFTFSSQPLAFAYTEKPCMGGRVWPNVRMENRKQEYALSLFGNSTLGILLYWWQSNRQQSSKASISLSTTPEFRTLNVTSLTQCQLDKAEEIFKQLKDQNLDVASRADTDPARNNLDKMVVCEMLGFSEDTFNAVRELAVRLCREPSILG